MPPVTSNQAVTPSPLDDEAATDAPAHERGAAAGDGTRTKSSVVESALTSVTGVALGGAAVWFLAPICFTC